MPYLSTMYELVLCICILLEYQSGIIMHRLVLLGTRLVL